MRKELKVLQRPFDMLDPWLTEILSRILQLIQEQGKQEKTKYL